VWPGCKQRKARFPSL